MLGDNEHEQTGGPFPAPRGGPMGRSDIIVHDRPRGYPVQDWWDEEPREHKEIDLIKYWRLVAKHWLMIAATVIVAVAIGVAVTLLTTPVFTARATLQIDRETARVIDVQSLDQKEALTGDEFFQTQHAILKSRWLSTDAVRSNGLARDPAVLKALGFAVPANAAAAATGGAQKEEAVISTIQYRLGVAPVQRSRIVAISFDSFDPAVSARIVNAIADSFVTSQLTRRVERSKDAREFLLAKLNEQKVLLEESERKLVDYARGQQIISIPTGGTDSNGAAGSTSLAGASLGALNGALNIAKTNRIRAQSRWERLQSDPSSMPEVLQSATIQGLKQAQLKLDNDYRDQASEFVPGGRLARPLDDNRAARAALDQEIASEITNIRNSIRAQYDSALAEERSLERQVGGLRNNMLDDRDRSIDYEILAREAETNRSLYDTILQSYQEVGVAGDVTANNVSILDTALPPGSPSKPDLTRNLITAALLGLLLGVGLALMLELLDESIRSPEDIERKLGLPLLGTIPRLPKGVSARDAMADLRSAFSEAYYSVRTALQFSTNEGAPRSLLVTSARPSEGKSTSATAIAQNFARLGMRVLLVDGDLRNPSLHRAFGVENSIGFSNYLTGSKTLEEVTQFTETANLVFVPCGPLPPSPAELLAGPRLQLMLSDAQRTFDVVVIDGPPVMGLADAPLLASRAAGTILVVEAGGTGRNLAKVAVRRLNVGAARILGVLLTKFDSRKTTYGYGYGYGYAYDYDYGSRPALKDGT